MNLYIYADESGVLDQEHNEYFVYGGLIFLNEYDAQECARKYISIEKRIRFKHKYNRDYELKAFSLIPKERSNIFRSLNNCFKFGVVVKQKKIHSQIFSSKKSKQRYLDYVFKIAVKKALQRLIWDKVINPDTVRNISFYVDEHTTATDGRYELREALEQELKYGTFNYSYQTYHKPLFNNLKKVDLEYCNSATTTLIRAADIIANKIFYNARSGNINNMRNQHMFIIILP